jgi:hypothetical protein
MMKLNKWNKPVDVVRYNNRLQKILESLEWMEHDASTEDEERSIRRMIHKLQSMFVDGPA